MLEFLFGWILGVWMGQQLPLPSVQMYVHNWWNSRAGDQAPPTLAEKPTEEEEAPLFTGEMPPAP